VAKNGEKERKDRREREREKERREREMERRERERDGENKAPAFLFLATSAKKGFFSLFFWWGKEKIAQSQQSPFALRGGSAKSSLFSIGCFQCIAICFGLFACKTKVHIT